MIDAGHKEVDALLKKVEREIAKLYASSKKKYQGEIEKAAKKFEAENQKHIKALKDGKETQEQYKRWRDKQLTSSLWVRDIIDNISKDITKTNKKAAEKANEWLPEAYESGYNYQLYVTEQTTKKKTSLELAKGVPEGNAFGDFLGALLIGGKMPYMQVKTGKDVTYNAKRAKSVMLQNMMGNFSMGRMKRTFGRLYDSARGAMIRNTRTRAGVFNNIGRYYSAYNTGERLDIKQEKVWIAILDMKTRHSHRMVDGERVKMADDFSNGLRFPQDPRGDASEVYNCRCDMLILPEGADIDLTERPDKLGDISYSEWKEQKLKDITILGMEANQNISPRDIGIIEDKKKGFFVTENGQAINRAEREGSPQSLPRHLQEVNEVLKRAERNNPLTNTLDFMRYTDRKELASMLGVSTNELNKMSIKKMNKVAGGFTNKSHVSVSLNEKNIFQDREVLIKGTVKKGTPVYITSNISQSEAVIGGGTVGSIHSIEKKTIGGRKYIVVTVTERAR